MIENQDPSRPPIEAIDLGGGVWASWTNVWSQEVNGVRYPMIWHYCDRSLAIEHDKDRADHWYEPRWIPTGVQAHTLVSADPLHIEPSLLWPGCCGKHGFIRNGRWESV